MTGSTLRNASEDATGTGRRGTPLDREEGCARPVKEERVLMPLPAYAAFQLGYILNQHSLVKDFIMTRDKYKKKRENNIFSFNPNKTLICGFINKTTNKNKGFIKQPLLLLMFILNNS